MSKVSVIIRARNEYPMVLTTMHSFLEDLESSNLDFEFVVVSNCSTDSLPDVLEDKYRRWVRAGILKVVRYDEKPSTWCAINAGYQVAKGDLICVADAHVSLKIGTMSRLTQGAVAFGGIWHAPVQIWGDTEDIKSYGYDLKLVERFWGDPCRWRPPFCGDDEPWAIAMAGACLYVATRETLESLSFEKGQGPYNKNFRAYGGGEPYLDLRSWMFGSKVYIHPLALVRHAFGVKAKWIKCDKDKTPRNSVMRKDGKFVSDLKTGEEFLSYHSDYSVSNVDMNYNFLLAAYILGGEAWLAEVANSFEKKYAKMPGTIAEARRDGRPDRDFVKANSEVSLDDLLASPPWHCCKAAEHKGAIASWIKNEGPTAEATA